jgi:hypothetical protein
MTHSDRSERTYDGPRWVLHKGRERHSSDEPCDLCCPCRFGPDRAEFDPSCRFHGDGVPARHVAECAAAIARYYETGNTGSPPLTTIAGFDTAVARLRNQLEGNSRVA